MHGYTFLLLTPFSFVKLFKKMIDELQLYQKILSRHQVNHFLNNKYVKRVEKGFLDTAVDY